MNLFDREVNTIEEAFLCQTERQQAHCQRVGAYADAAFAKVISLDLYVNEPRGSRELISEYRHLAEISGRYHDIGKLLPDEEENPVTVIGEDEPEPPKEHTRHGVELVQALYPGFSKLKATERRIILEGVQDHHERMDGSGTPARKVGSEISYMGRILAIADELDHRAMEARSEDPIGDALTAMAENVKKGKLDKEFFRAFRAAKPKLRKIFDENHADSAAVPKAEPWIRRREGRPMELHYRKAPEIISGQPGWYAEMRFRNVKDNSLTYAEVNHIIAAKRMTMRLGDYFLYELCDTIRRFDACGIPLKWAAVELPGGWYKQKNLAGHVLSILEDEGVDPHRVMLLIPDEVRKRATKTWEENAAAAWQAYLLMLSWEDFLHLAAPEGEFRREDDIVREALARSEEGGVSG